MTCKSFGIGNLLKGFEFFRETLSPDGGGRREINSLACFGHGAAEYRL